MSDFSSYKQCVLDDLARERKLFVGEQDMSFFLMLARRAFTNRVSVTGCAEMLDRLLGTPEAEPTFSLTEAAEVALAQRDALQSTDAALGLRSQGEIAGELVSAGVIWSHALGEALPVLDPCSDDEPRSLPEFARPIEKQRKVPRK